METTDIMRVLAHSPLFKEIPKQVIELFLNNHSYKIETYSKSDVIALMDDPCNFLLVVLEGNVIARMVSDSGKFLQIEKIGVGRILAPAMLFATENRFPVNVIPEGEVILFKMSKKEFVKSMQENETLLFNFMQIVSDISRFLTNKIHFLSLMSLKVKLAQYFLEYTHIQDNSRVIEIPISRQELADRFGVSRQSLIRSLTELEEEHLIQVNNRQISILDKEGLRNL